MRDEELSPILHLLLERGADIDARNIRGETPLIHAAASGAVVPLKWLLENRADINAKTKYCSASQWASVCLSNVT